MKIEKSTTFSFSCVIVAFFSVREVLHERNDFSTMILML